MSAGASSHPADGVEPAEPANSVVVLPAQTLGPRLALVGAFPFVTPQGSQVYLRDQALALAEMGARPVVVSYGRGPERPPSSVCWRPIPRWLSPRRVRSGPGFAKLLADPALWWHLVALHRRRPFDAILAHNVEAAAVALAARRRIGVPVVYVAHTLMGFELSHYVPHLIGSLLDPMIEPVLDKLGAAMDRALARRADGVIALSEPARSRLARFAAGPVERIPPGRPAAPQTDPALGRALCRDLGLEPGRFALYTGNLDDYQGLDRLAEAARILSARGIAVVVATHEGTRSRRARIGSSAARSGRGRIDGLRVHTVANLDQVLALTAVAGVLLLPRRTPGGFPIKLLNYLASGRPVIALASGACDLKDDLDGVVLPDSVPAGCLANAIEELLADRARADRLARAGLERLRRHHDWAELANRTLELVGRVIRARQ